MKKICVFCSSSEAISPQYFKIGVEIGNKIAENNYELIYGGANVGLMKTIADTVKKQNRKVTGVIPEVIYNKGLANKNVDELIVTTDMYARKQKMNELADAFITLPGGFGTLEELSEIITHKQLQLHYKPIIIFNQNNFYSNLLKQYDVFYNEKFSKNVYRDLYYITDSVKDTFDYIKNYTKQNIDSKWFDVSKKEFEES